jgi:hypothetical protein
VRGKLVESDPNDESSSVLSCMTVYDLAKIFFYPGMDVGMHESLGYSVDLSYAAGNSIRLGNGLCAGGATAANLSPLYHLISGPRIQFGFL